MSAPRDAAYAACLAVVLVSGVLGVLLLNTAMQRQADSIAAQQHRLESLALSIQTTKASLDHTADPVELARQARELHMHPAAAMRFLTVGNRRVVTEQRPAAG